MDSFQTDDVYRPSLKVVAKFDQVIHFGSKDWRSWVANKANLLHARHDLCAALNDMERKGAAKKKSKPPYRIKFFFFILLAENQRNTYHVGSLPACFVHTRKRRNQVFQETFNRDSKEDPNEKSVQVRADKKRLMLSMLWMKTVLGLICLVEDCGPQNQWSDVKSNPFSKGIHFESISVFLPGLINTGVAMQIQ